MPFGTLAQPLAAPTRAVPRMEKFIIEGGYPLSGTVVPAGNKNAALPLIAASLLTEEEVVLRNVPRIRDVEAMLELLIRLGVKTCWLEDNVVSLKADEVDHTEVDPEWSERIRASFLLAGPLLAGAVCLAAVVVGYSYALPRLMERRLPRREARPDP